MSVYVLDSNIVSFYIRQIPQIIQKVNDTLIAEHEILMSPIVYYEVKRGLLTIKAEKRLKEFDSLCQIFGVGQLDNSLLDIASDIYIELRDKKQSIEDADILTASFCKRYDFILVTNNTKHFANISGLNFCDWM